MEEDEPEETKEGYMPTNDMPSDKDRKTAGKLGALLKRERDAKEKKEPNGVKTEEVEEIEEKRGLWDNIHAKRKRIKAGSGERMRKPGSEGAPSAADLKASQKEEVSLDDAFEQIDEISSDMAHRYLKGKRERDYDISADGKSSKLKKPQSFGKMNKDMKSTARALRTIEKAKKTNEEVEELDEISKATMGRYINKAKDSIDMASYRQGHKEAHGSSSKPLEKKLTKRHKGIETAVKKLTKEDAEQIDELSKDTMGRYINKAATKMGSQGVTAGLKIAADEKSSKNFKDMGKREKGIKLAVNKLTKEEQDFIDALNADTLDEARGRPRKAGARDFTIHPKTKEKLMHNNPEHMKRIERLQKTGMLQKPKTEAGQHIMNQLQKAKTSMTGGTTINFTHGDSKHVSGTHAARLLDKYAGMKPNEKEDFQKKIGHSHEKLKSEL
jgi:predicted DNA-binding protein (UPF0251 family)